MNKPVSVALCSLAAALWALPATANDADKARAGANASVEGGAALGGTGAGTASSQPRTGDNAGAGARTGDTQARHDNADARPGTQAQQDEDKNKRKNRAQRKAERDASSGVTGSGKTY